MGKTARFDAINRFTKSFIENIQDFRWLLIVLLWVTAYALSCWGIWLHFAITGEERSFLDPFYRTFQLIFLDDSMVVSSGGKLPWQLELSRFLLPSIAASTALLALFTVFRKEFEAIRCKMVKGHVVICGLGRKGMLLAEGFVSNHQRVVAIDKDESENLSDYCREHGILLVRGDAREPEILAKAKIHRASHVVALSGDDGINAEIAVRCWELMKEHPKQALHSYCHIFDPTLCRLLRERELMSEMADNYRLEFFNVFDSAARLVLDLHPRWLAAESGAQSHIVVVGVGHMGESLIGQVARRWWPRYVTTKEKLRITGVDKNSGINAAHLSLTFPRLSECTTFDMVYADVNEPEFMAAPFLNPAAADYCTPSTVFVCLDNDSAGLAAALRLLQFYRNQDVPIVVRMEHDSGLATLLLGEDSRSGSAFSSLHAFGMLDRTCMPENLFNDTRMLLAKTIHQNYLDEMENAGDTPQTNSSMKSWEELPPDLQESNMKQADHIGVKLHAVRCGIGPLYDWAAQPLQFRPEEIETLAKIEHDRFVNERSAAGWIYSPGLKNPAKKTNPTLVPWEQLSEEERKKDRDAVNNIPAILAMAGFEVYRLKG
jgi:hypothetical protein